MPLRSAWHRLRLHRSRRRLFVLLLLAGVAFLLLGLLPELVRRALTARLAAATAAAVHLTNVDLDPLRGGVTLEDLSVILPGDRQPAVIVRALDINLALLALLRGRIRAEAVSLSGVHVEVIQQPDGRLNLGRLLPPAETAASQVGLPALTVEHLALSDAQIHYQDRTRTPPPTFVFAIEGLRADGIALRSDGLNAPVTVSLQGRLNESPLRGEATVLWQRTHTGVEVRIDVQQLTLSALKPYLRHVPAVQHASGHAGARLDYRYRSGEGVQTVHRLDGSLTLHQVRVTDPLSGQTVVDLPAGEVTVERVDFLAREIRLAAAHLANAHLLVLRTATGLNWATLVQPDNAEPDAEPGARHGPVTSPWRFFLREARLTGGELRYRESAWADTEFISVVPEEITVRHIGGDTAESPVRFHARVGDGGLTGEGALQFSPFSLRLQVQLSDLNLALLQPLLTRLLTATQVSGRVTAIAHTTWSIHNGGQTVGLSGTVDTAAVGLTGFPEAQSELGWQSGRIEFADGSTLAPLAVGLNTQLSAVTFRRPAPGTLTVGQATGSMRLTWQEGADLRVAATEAGGGEPASQPPLASLHLPALLAHGSVMVRDVVLKGPQDQQILLACYHGQAQLREGSRFLPLALHVHDLVLDYSYGQLVRTSSGRFALFAPVTTSAQEPTGAAARGDAAASPVPFAIHIDRATVRGGEIFFADHTLTPPQTVFWQNVELDLTDAQYPPPRIALLALRAFNEDGAPVRLRGTVGYADQQTVVKVRGEVERLSLPRFNRYLAPLGYPVRDGALSLRFDIVVPGNQLQAKSDVTLHDLGLGSGEGTAALEKQIGLPLSLVVALLKDLHGNINLQVPVRGRLDEPSFQLRGTILRAVRDAVVGAVTSPLKLLGAVFTRKGQIRNFTLAPITFLPGTSQYSEQGEQQLARLGEFLARRPELSVEFSGHTGPADAEVLRDRLVLAQLHSLPSPTAPPQPVPAEPQGVASQSTPRDEVKQFLASRLGQAHSVAAPTLSTEASTLLAQLRAQAVLPAEDLERLATERVQGVIADLITRHAIASSRLLLARGKAPGREGAEVRYLLQSVTQSRSHSVWQSRRTERLND